MSKVQSTLDGKVRVIPLHFRFKVVSTGLNTVEVHIPVSSSAPPLVRLDATASSDLNLSAKEHDRALDAAEEAALRSILIHD